MSSAPFRSSSSNAGATLSDQQRKVLRDIGLCRTAALGTHLERCDRCSYETLAYDSCRNRHCPKCQSSAPDRWLLKQAASLLPVSYVHAVFTVPEPLMPIALRNQKVFYSVLFRAASETLLKIAADPRHLGLRWSADRQSTSESGHSRRLLLRERCSPSCQLDPWDSRLLHQPFADACLI